MSHNVKRCPCISCACGRALLAIRRPYEQQMNREVSRAHNEGIVVFLATAGIALGIAWVSR